MKVLIKSSAILSVCFITVHTIGAADNAADRTLTGDRLRVLNALLYIGGDFKSPPKQRYINRRFSGVIQQNPGLKLARTSSVIELRRNLAVGRSLIEESEYTLSDKQVRVLSDWKGSSSDSSSSQLAAIIRGSAKPSSESSNLNASGYDKKAKADSNRCSIS